MNTLPAVTADAEALVRAPAETVWSVLITIEDWPRWNDDVVLVRTTESLRVSGMPTSRWSFRLMDPDEPCIPGFDPPWFYRGTVDCNRMRFMVESDFHLCLRPSIGFRRVRSLLADPIFAGIPPTLHIERDIDENESWTITFHRGTGVGWHSPAPEYARSHFRASLEDTLEVIRAVRVFSRDYRNSAAFRALRKALQQAYESC